MHSVICAYKKIKKETEKMCSPLKEMLNKRRNEKSDLSHKTTGVEQSPSLETK